jgi:hypothetical protein
MVRNKGDEEMKEDVAGRQDPSNLSPLIYSFLDSLMQVKREDAYKMLFEDEIMDVEGGQNIYFNGLDDLLDDEFQIMRYFEHLFILIVNYGLILTIK